ncbi:hypothetical protein [Streptomyces altiplanensis]
MTTTEQAHLTTVIRHWTDLRDALGAPAKVASFGVGLRGYLAALDRIDEQQAEADRQAALDRRLLERDPSQIGERPTPVRIAIFDTMQAVHADLLECADATAAGVQREPMRGPAPNPQWPDSSKGRRIMEADRARTAVLAMQDAHDPRRWKWAGPRPTAPLAALWLLGRVQGAPGPFHRLTPQQAGYIASVARSAADRVEKALDIAAQLAPITKPCPELRNLVPCGGRIEVRGGAGASPLAHCVRCGRIWSEQGVAA